MQLERPAGLEDLRGEIALPDTDLSADTPDGDQREEPPTLLARSARSREEANLRRAARSIGEACAIGRAQAASGTLVMLRAIAYRVGRGEPRLISVSWIPCSRQVSRYLCVALPQPEPSQYS